MRGHDPGQGQGRDIYTQAVLAQPYPLYTQWLTPIVSSIHLVVLSERVLSTRDDLVRVVSSIHSKTSTQPSRSAVVSRSKRTAFSTSGELYLGCRLCRAGCETAAKPVSFFCTRVMVQCKVQLQGLTMPSQRCQIAEIWERRVIIDSKGLQCQQKRTRGLLSSVYSARVL